MKELKNYRGVVIFLLILTVLNFLPTNNTTSTEYVKGNDDNTKTEVAANI